MPFERDRNDPFRWALDVSTALMAAPGTGESLQEVAHAIGEAMSVTSADIVAYDAEREIISPKGAWDAEGLSERQLGLMGANIPLGQRPLLAKVIESRRIEEVQASAGAGEADEGAPATQLLAPLVIADEVYGVLIVAESRYERHFMSMEIDRFRQLAMLAAAAIRNARLREREGLQGKRLEALLEAIAAVTTRADSREALAVATRAVAVAVGASSGAVFERASGSAGDLRPVCRYDEAAFAGGGHMATGAAWPADLAELLEEGEPRVCLAGDEDADEALREDMAHRGERDRLYLPLVVHDKTLGVFVLGRSGARHPLTAGELEFANAARLLLASGLAVTRRAAQGPEGAAAGGADAPKAGGAFTMPTDDHTAEIPEDLGAGPSAIPEDDLPFEPGPIPEDDLQG